MFPVRWILCFQSEYHIFPPIKVFQLQSRPLLVTLFYATVIFRYKRSTRVDRWNLEWSQYTPTLWNNQTLERKISIKDPITNTFKVHIYKIIWNFLNQCPNLHGAICWVFLYCHVNLEDHRMLWFVYVNKL